VSKAGVIEPAVAVAPRRGFAMGLMVVGSAAISFGGLVVRNIEGADSWQIIFYRAVALVAAIGLILVFRYRRKTAVRVLGIGRVGLLGGLMLAVAQVTFLQSVVHTTVANTLFIVSAIPFFTAGLAWIFLKEGLRRETLVAMVFAAAGVLVMVAEGFGAGSVFGNVMALTTALAFSGFAIVVRRHRDIDMLPTILVSGATVGVTALVVQAGDLAISWHDALLCLFWGGVLSGLANGLFIVAARHLVAAEVTLFMLLEFALGPVWVWLFVAEVPSAWTVLGGALVMSAVAARAVYELQFRRENRRRRAVPKPPVT